MIPTEVHISHSNYLTSDLGAPIPNGTVADISTDHLVEPRTVLDMQDVWLDIHQGGRIHTILRGVNLRVQAGRIHALVGESGGGKSMVTRVATGLLPVGARIIKGQVHLNGKDTRAYRATDWQRVRGAQVSMVLQDPMTALNPIQRIGVQMAEVLQLQLGHSRAQAWQQAAQLLHQVQVREPERVLRQFPHQLSGGMRQRVVIAIAWACKPSLILCDEPTTALDVSVQKQVLRLIRELAAQGIGILLVTHDLGVVAKLAHSMSVIHSGRILEEGAVEQVYAKPQHPYTRALLAATPRFDQPAHVLQPMDEALIDQLNQEAQAMQAWPSDSLQ